MIKKMAGIQNNARHMCNQSVQVRRIRSTLSFKPKPGVQTTYNASKELSDKVQGGTMSRQPFYSCAENDFRQYLSTLHTGHFHPIRGD